MVRLKAAAYWSLKGKYTVSIPYGTIKRAEKAYQRNIEMVSIPYGTIKSPLKTCVELKIRSFNSLWYD